MMRVDPCVLRKQLLARFRRKADRLGIHVLDECMGLVERLIGQGIERMSADRVLDRPDKVMQIESAIDSVVDSMAIQSRQLGTFPQAGEKTLAMAKHEFCPLWPLC